MTTSSLHLIDIIGRTHTIDDCSHWSTGARQRRSDWSMHLSRQQLAVRLAAAAAAARTAAAAAASVYEELLLLVRERGDVLCRVSFQRYDWKRKQERADLWCGQLFDLSGT